MLLASGSALATPFNTTNQNPFSLISGIPLPVDAQLPESGSYSYNFAVETTNTLNTETNAQEQIQLDFEAYHLKAGFNYSLNKDWAIKLTAPIIIRSGGVFDQAIDDWHTFFNLPRGSRPNVTNNQYQIQYINAGSTITNLTQAVNHIGDIQLSLGRRLLDYSDKSLSAWMTFDFPTGDQSNLTGSNDIDTSLYLAANKRLNSSWNVFGNLGVLFPGEAFTTTLKQEKLIWFGHMGLSWQWSPEIKLQVQLNGHTRLYENSSLRLFSDTYELVFGGAIKINACSALQIAFSEDIKVGAAPDISVLINWQKNIGKC